MGGWVCMCVCLGGGGQGSWQVCKVEGLLAHNPKRADKLKTAPTFHPLNRKTGVSVGCALPTSPSHKRRYMSLLSTALARVAKNSEAGAKIDIKEP